MLKSDFCNYSDTYIAVKGAIDLLAADANENDKAEKNIAPFRSCISKINSTLIDNAEDLDIAMPMYNLLEYSQNYCMTSKSSWKYYRNKVDGFDDNTSDVKSFEYKTKTVGKTPGRALQPGNPWDANRTAQPAIPSLNAEVIIQLNYLSNFWRLFYLPLINCEIELDLS